LQRLQRPGVSAPLPAALYQGAVNTWECDQNGHLNVRFHLERAIIGLAHLAAALDMRQAFTAEAGATLAPLDLHIRFIKEAHANAALSMRGGVIEFGEQEGVVCMDMRHSDGAPGTTFRLRVSHVEPFVMRQFPWSSRTQAAAKRLACALPDHAKARSIDLSRTPGEATLARAQTLGAQRIGASAVTPDQCDAFGRLRADHIFGRVSDSVPHLFAEWRREAAAAGAPTSLAGAVVEARIAFRRWPRAGDLIEIHSAVVEALPKTTRIVHWLLDPCTGAAWATVEAVAVTFDMHTRKVAELPAALLASRQARAIAAMAI
jgi:acyl-CoA thioester hydrolase